MFRDFDAIKQAWQELVRTNAPGYKFSREPNKTNQASDQSGAFSMPETAEPRYSREKTTCAPTFYSKLERVVDEMKLARLGAANGVAYMKGRGVKDEEIKWSGLEDFLKDKKSVSKEELLENSENGALPYTDAERRVPFGNVIGGDSIIFARGRWNSDRG